MVEDEERGGAGVGIFIVQGLAEDRQDAGRVEAGQELGDILAEVPVLVVQQGGQR
jgi:hypothetical protein